MFLLLPPPKSSNLINWATKVETSRLGILAKEKTNKNTHDSTRGAGGAHFE
jgi:hypothetical protein